METFETVNFKNQPIKDIEKTTSSNVTFEESEMSSWNPQNNYLYTLVVLIKANIGSGVFSMGIAFKNGGLVVTAILVVIVGFISTTCQHLMLNACDETSKRMKSSHSLGYEEASGLCFEHGDPRFRKLAPIFRRIVVVSVFTTQCAFCCVYVMFIATNVKQMWDVYMDSIPLSAMMAIVMVPLLLLSWIKDIRSLAPMAAVANILILFGIIVVFVEAIPRITSDSISHINLSGTVSTIPLAFGTVIYSFEGIGLVSPVRKSYKHPERFANMFGPLNTCMFIIGSFIMSLGMVGYLGWGDEVDDSLTLNLDQTSVIGQTTRGLLSVAILFTYPLQMLPALEIIKPKVRKRFPKLPRLLVHFAVPTVISLVLFLLAESVPHLALFISLVGAVTSTTLALLVPPIMDTVTFYENYGKFKWRIVRNSAIFIFGIIGFFTGASFSIRDIVNIFQTGSSKS